MTLSDLEGLSEIFSDTKHRIYTTAGSFMLQRPERVLFTILFLQL